jgi:hypothetical protein
MFSLQDFMPLKPAEQILLDAALRGKPCFFAPARPDAATPANELRADFLRFLALGGEHRKAVHESGLKIQGAFVDGAVNLDGATKVRPLWIQDCTVTGEFSFSDAETKVMSLDRTAVSGIRGDGVLIDGSLLLRETLIEGSLQLFGAEIAGTLSCSGCSIAGKPWRTQRLAADLETVTIGGNVEFRNGFLAGEWAHPPRQFRDRRNARLHRRQFFRGLWRDALRAGKPLGSGRPPYPEGASLEP